MRPTNEPFQQSLETIAKTKSSIVSVYSDIVKMAACAVACQTREDEYLQTIKSYSKEELEQLCKSFGLLVNEMQNQPFSDLLGKYYQEISSKVTRDQNGEFYTPEEISALIAKITVDTKSVIEKGQPITVNEPACGGGGMILQLAKQFSPEILNTEKSYVDLLRVTAQDISPIAADMTYVNCTLWGIPTRVMLGNVLANNYTREWKNIHWMRVKEDQRLAYEKMLKIIRSPESPQSKSSPPTIVPSQIDLGDLKQVSFEF